MKAHLLVAISLGAASAAVLAGADTSSSRGATEAYFVDADSAEVREIRALGERAITRVGMSLVSEVSSTIAKQGVEKAVEVCHLKALPLTGEIIAGMPRITAVKRTSLKLRNPANAPDEAEKRALDRFAWKLDDGNPPSVLIQRLDHPAVGTEWRVYRPVVILQQCVTCHGAVENQPPGLRATLQERYPDDAASGYRLHDWRGLIRVSVSEPPPPQPATVPPKTAPAKGGTKRK
jgi:hypothetical protein